MGFWDYATPGALGGKIIGGMEADEAMRVGQGRDLRSLQRLALQRAQGQGQSIADLQGQAMLRSGLAQQQSLLAGARPGTMGLAQRQASQNSGHLAAQISEKTQAARLQEQMQNMGLAGNLLIQGRSQAPAMWERLLGGISGAATTGAVASDIKFKKDIKDGDDDVEATLSGLRDLAFKYKNSVMGKFGQGPQVGIMAQDLERTPIGKQAVVNTPAGKMIDAGKLSGFNAAAAVNLHKRLRKLEAKKPAEYDDEDRAAAEEDAEMRRRFKEDANRRWMAK